MSIQRNRGHKTLIVGGLGATLVLAMAATNAIAAPTPAPTAKPVACPTTPGIDNATIKIGAVFPQTGPVGPTFAGFDSAAKLRFAQENAKGGINGRKIVVTSYDDQASGATQSQIATKLTQQDNIFGVVSASVTDTMYPVLKNANIPVAGLPNLPPYYDNVNAFGAYGPYNPNITSNTGQLRMAQVGATKFGVLNHVSPAAESSANAFAAAIPTIAGASVVLRKADLPQGTYDATSTALLIKNSGANGVYAVLLPDGGAAIAQALAQQNVKLAAYYVPALTDPAVLSKAGSVLEGTITAGYGTVPISVNKPGVRTFAHGMKAAGLNPEAPLSPIGFIAADILVKGLKAAGPCPTRAGVIKALRKVGSYDGAGLLPGPVSFKPGLAPDGDGSPCTWFSVIKNSKAVADPKAVCGKILDATTLKPVG